MNPYAWQPNYYPQNPPTFMPPTQNVGGFSWTPPWSSPQTEKLKEFGISAPRSSRYPTLNPSLAPDTCLIRYDISKKPYNSISRHAYNAHRYVLATAVPCYHLRLISKQFPWTIEVVLQTGVTCEGVWDALYAALQEHIMDSEWGMIVMDKKRKEMAERAHKKRIEKDLDSMYKRIDYLGENVILKGLERDTEYEKQRLMKGVDPCAETWLVKLGT